MGGRRSLMVLAVVLCVAAMGSSEDDPKPGAWPEQFHAVLVSERGGRLQMDDLYYDWPNGRNLNLIRPQLSEDPLWDVEWQNHTSFYFHSRSPSCRTMRFPVGLLPPDWLLRGGAPTYLGRQSIDGFDCHVWTKAHFIHYYEDVLTHRPVRWDFFDGMQQHVMTFEVGVVLEDSKWQAPSYCFPAAHENGNDMPEDEEDDDTAASVNGLDILRRLFGNFAATASL